MDIPRFRFYRILYAQNIRGFLLIETDEHLWKFLQGGNLKRIYILLIIFFICLPIGVRAQFDFSVYGRSDNGFELGVLGGVGVSSVNLENKIESEEIKMTTGFSGGVFLRYVFDENFSVQPAAIYSNMGGEISSSAKKHVYKCDYINIPVVLNMTFPMHPVIKPRIFMGPEFGIVLKANDEVEESGINRSEANIKSRIKKPNFCMVFGAGIDYAVGTNNVVLDFRYHVGLNDINDGFTYTKVFTRNFSFMAGYSISI
jgi:hypothetical protein